MAILLHNCAQNFINQNFYSAKAFTFRMSPARVKVEAREEDGQEIGVLTLGYETNN